MVVVVVVVVVVVGVVAGGGGGGVVFNSRAKTRSFHRSAQNCEEPSPTERAVRSILLLLPKCINHNFSFFSRASFFPYHRQLILT